MLIERYNSDKKQQWDKFVKESKNGTFLFLRDYMDYHSDRFHDHSLMYYNDKGKLIAILPANDDIKPSAISHMSSTENDEQYDSSNEQSTINLHPTTIYSHQGLTYGGFVLTQKIHASEIKELFETTLDYLRENGIKEWFYKQMPTIYHKLPSEEDEYWLWRNGAELAVCNLATSVPLDDYRLKLTEKCRVRRNRQSLQYGFQIDYEGSLDTVFSIINESLMAHHNAKPIHTLEEMKTLRDSLPQYIKTLTVKDKDGNDMAGAVLYCSDQVVHVQYAHATIKGYDCHVMDYLYFALMDKFSREGNYKYFDFGTSNEDAGRFLNENLVAQKEGFGGRGITYKTYRICVG